MASLPWNIPYVKADLAWPMLPQKTGGGIDWGPVCVAHLDTGYTKHEAFGPWGPKDANDIIRAKDGRDYYTTTPSKKNARDPLTKGALLFPGHGTRSGSALAGHDPAEPFTGVAPGLPLIPLRVAAGSLITTRVNKAIGKAIEHVVRTKKAKIISISLGFPILFDSAMGAAIDKAYKAGILVIAAAGQQIDQVSYPGKHKRTICVAGISKAGKRYFNYYPYERYNRIDAWAPAKPIARGNYLPNDRYGTGDGTTYATLHVTAAAAMWLRHHGAAIDQRYSKPWQRVEAFRAALKQSQRPLPFKSPPTNHAGKLDIFNLLSKPLPDPKTLHLETDLAADDRV